MTMLLIGATGSDAEAARSTIESVMLWAKVETPWQLVLVAFGVFAQLMFAGRWLVQWIATERRRRSHVPVLFWWLSLLGASMLFVYFTLRGEPVGMLGQSIGWVIYLRNLQLIRRKGRRA